MKKDKSVRKAEFKKAAIKQLKSLIAPMIFLLVVVAAVLVIFLLKSPEEEEVKIELIKYEEDDHEIVLENKDLKLTMDSATTQFEVLVKKTGKVWYSTPQNAANDSKALPVTKENLQSTLILTYTNKEGVDTLYNNYANSIVNKTYAITESDDCISVKYYVGVPEKEFYIPYAMSEERFNTFLDMMSPDDVSWAKMQYKKYDLEKLSDDINKDALISMYPILNSEPAYLPFQIIKTDAEVQEKGKDLYAENMALAVKEKLAKVFEGIGYTEDDYKEDMKNVNASAGGKKAAYYVTVNYKLDGDQLVVEVPMEEILFNSDYPLLKLAVLPYFGATTLTDEGYMLVPEGGGALINFNNGKIKQTDYYSQLYGWDVGIGREALVNEPRSYFNAFALASGNDSFLCIIDSGEEYAGISADVSDKKHSYNYVNATYTIAHREEYKFSGNNTGKMFVYEDQIPQDTLVQKYSFLGTNDYADIAKEYGEYLAKKNEGAWNLVDDANVPVAVEIVGAVDKIEQVVGIPVRRPLKLTTYNDAKKIIEELLGYGIDNMSVKLSGWMNGGINQQEMSSVDLIGRLGNAKSLKKLIKYAQENGVDFYLDGVTNYVRNDKFFDSFIVWRDAARFVSDLKVELKDYSTIWYGKPSWYQPYYLVKPSLVMKYMDNLYKAANKYGSEGISFRDIGYELSGDYNPDKPVSRHEAKDMQVEKLAELKEKGCKIMINMGNDYALQYADFITNMNLSGIEYAILDEKIPFYQLAIHGYKNYTAEAINLSNNADEAVLRAAEYGAGLSFVLMAEDAMVLQKTYFTQYFASDYNAWKSKLAEVYTRYAEELGHVFNMKMTDHEILTSDVRVTTFEDGTRVYVNYSFEDYVTTNGVNVPAKDYVVVRGKN